MLAGIIIQLGKCPILFYSFIHFYLLTRFTIVAVILFTILALEFVIRFSLNRPARSVADEQEKYNGWATVPQSVMKMLVGLAIATLFIVIRSVYRTIELTDGW